jgi:DNA invertase Pin-like site-specific DNA recombinase
MIPLMKCVTYARASTKGQADYGTSLQDQAARFQAWQERSGHTILQAYAEPVSGGKNTRTALFNKMLADLLPLGAEALVVDSIDRFTRDSYAGIAMTEKLREMGVQLWELEYEEDRPFDLKLYADRDYVMRKFTDAEAERRRIKARHDKRYAQQRARGATVCNKPAFGLKLAGEARGNRRLVADPATAPVVAEIDRMTLAGASANDVLAFLADFPAAPKSRRGLAWLLLNAEGSYVAAGVRSIETQQRLNALLEQRKQVYGPDRSTRSVRPSVHYLSGLVVCKACSDAGFINPLMHGKTNHNTLALVCEGERNGQKVHDPFWASASLVQSLLEQKLERLRDLSVAQRVVAKWEAEPTSDAIAALRATLTAELSALDAMESDLDRRAKAALSLALDGGPGATEARRLLADVEEQRAAVTTKRSHLATRLAGLPAQRVATFTAEDLQYITGSYPNARITTATMELEGQVLEGPAVESDVRTLIAKYVNAIGAPTLARGNGGSKRGNLVLEWSAVDVA